MNSSGLPTPAIDRRAIGITAALFILIVTGISAAVGFIGSRHGFDWTLAAGVAFNGVAFAFCLPLVQRFRAAKMPLFRRRWYDVPLRAGLVALLVAP